MVAGTQEEETRGDELAGEYRAKKLGSVKIRLKVYKNELKNEQVQAVQTDYISLFQGNQWKKEGILWYEERFARLSGDCKINLEVVHTDGKKEESTLLIHNPQVEDFWHVGVELLEGFQKINMNPQGSSPIYRRLYEKEKISLRGPFWISAWGAPQMDPSAGNSAGGKYFCMGYCPGNCHGKFRADHKGRTGGQHPRSAAEPVRDLFPGL
jgi:hypothetical protein